MTTAARRARIAATASSIGGASALLPIAWQACSPITVGGSTRVADRSDPASEFIRNATSRVQTVTASDDRPQREELRGSPLIVTRGFTFVLATSMLVSNNVTCTPSLMPSTRY